MILFCERLGKRAKAGRNLCKKKESGLKKRATHGILNDSDVVYPEYDVRKVLESGSSGTPFFRPFVDTN
jgi:hypothetical protein